MKPTDFVIKYYPFAAKTEINTGINLVAILAQAALESGWGENAPGNMFFGIKADKNWKGLRQLLTTFEYFNDDKQGYRFPEVISITPKNNRYLYTVKDYFRAYETPEGSFNDHADFFFKNSRYSEALKVKHDYKLFIQEIAKAGYATATSYADTLISIADSIQNIIENNNLEATIKSTKQ